MFRSDSYRSLDFYRSLDQNQNAKTAAHLNEKTLRCRHRERNFSSQLLNISARSFQLIAIHILFVGDDTGNGPILPHERESEFF